ncbi:MAG: ABC transporter permease, partial [Ottowia sp.]|nr:ABC transporter permease [Ottowia sp.]
MSKVSSFAQGWRTLWRDWRAGELRLALVAVALAVAALTAVGFFSDRLQGGLQRDARQLLGGDAVLVSDNPPPADWLAEARRLGLRSTQTLSFPTMARAPDALGGAARLVALKAVPMGYPLRGQLRTSETPADTEGSPAQSIPASGQVWVEAPLLEALDLKVGDTLLLGDASLRIARVLTFEPDRGAGFMSFAPRVLLNAADLAATGLVQPASRITWRLAVAGDPA